MATAVVNNIAEPNGCSKSDEIDVACSASSREDFEAATSTENIKSQSSADETTELLVSQNDEKNDPPSRPGSADDTPDEKDLTHEDPKNQAKRKYRNILDSDSEKEDDFISSLLNKSYADESSSISNLAKAGKSSRKIIDSESEEEDSKIAVENGNCSDKDDFSGDDKLDESRLKEKPTKPRFQTLIDSDSEDDKLMSQDSQKNDEKSSSEESTSPKKYPAVRKRKTKSDKKIIKSNKISSLIDTDSEDDGQRNNVDETPRNEPHKSGNLAKPEKSAKKRTGSIRASKDEAMRQIHSETQRLIRSTEVSLPYHRPKQRSLQEFLNRKKFIPALPEGLSTAAKVRMSSEIVGRVLKEKEKEAELFYKSSDSEDEETISSTPANPPEEIAEKIADSPVDHSNIEDTQKLSKNDVQNAHNKKEIIQQGAVDLGVPRKLFANEPEHPPEDKPMETAVNTEEATESDEPGKKPKETKCGLREGSVPRKLFASDFEESVASSNAQVAPASQSPEINSNPEAPKSPPKNNVPHSPADSEKSAANSKSQDSETEENPEDTNLIARDATVKRTSEFSNISDTPFISNKEFAKINENASRQRVDSDEADDPEDSKEPATPHGHVFGLPPPDFEGEEKRAEKLSAIKKKFSSNACPKLRGAPGTFIDLSDDVKPNREGVQSLVERFMRHSAPPKTAEVSTSVTVLHTEKTAEGLKIVEQVLPYKLSAAENFSDKELSKPGAKYLRLKHELMEKMARKRGEEWRLKKQREKDENPEEEENEEEEEIIEEECEDEADEMPLNSELQISGESEPEEDDMPQKKRKSRKNHDFADEEAEVSDEEMEVGDEEDDEEEQEDDEEEQEDQEEEQEDEEEEEQKESTNTKEVIDEDDDTRDAPSDAETETPSKRKKPSRIIKAFEDDSNSLPETPQPNPAESRKKPFERTRTDVDMFAPEDEGNDGWSDTEGELPPSQIPRGDQTDGRSQLCKTPLTAVDILRFVSPITQLTAFDSCAESPRDGNSAKSTPAMLRLVGSSTEKTPLAKESPISINSEKRNGFQKKLFEDPAGAVNDDELMDLCSGKFTGTQHDDDGVKSHTKIPDSPFLSPGIRSEAFEKISPSNPQVDENSQDMRLTLDDDSRDKFVGEQPASKRKTPWAAFDVASSSDDEKASRENRDEAKARKKKLTKKRVKKLELSDDEEEAASLNEEEEEDFDILDDDKEEKYVDYDSEENEVVVVAKKDLKKVAAGFLDEEAELSESEWGSADEDEKGLDKLELEAGDDEEIDENQMRDQLGKMHARQVLDDDQREVRYLQELLFDDGDLHTEGGGRERQFKWKNIDNLGEDDKLGPRNDEFDENGEAIEEENDLEWRKQRLEREKFIEEKLKSADDILNDELDSGSQIFKLGMKALKKSKSSGSSQKEPDAPFTNKPTVPRTVLDLFGSPAGQNSRTLNKAVKRGSFLARGDACLARLAVQIKQSETVITNRKKHGNFVFQHISPSVAGTADKEEETEATTDVNSPANSKVKKRKPPAGITPRTAKKAKIEITRSSGKKLF